MGFIIKNVWAFIAVDDDGDEGILAMKVGNDWMPMVMADEKRIKSMRPIAERMAKDSGKTVKFVCFSNRTDLEAF